MGLSWKIKQSSGKEGRACMFIYGDLKFLYNIASFETDNLECATCTFILLLLFTGRLISKTREHI